LTAKPDLIITIQTLTKEALMAYDASSVFYDVQRTRDGSTIKLRSRETGRVLKDPAALSVQGLPEEFTRRIAYDTDGGAVWQSSLPPIKAMTVLGDAGFRFDQDEVDKLEALAVHADDPGSTWSNMEVTPLGETLYPEGKGAPSEDDGETAVEGDWVAVTVDDTAPESDQAKSDSAT
jgi:hypothetical protein